MPKKPEILARKLLASSRHFQIESLDLRFSNGERREFERLSRGNSSGGAVLIVAMPDPDTVFLVREYAAGVDRYELGFPKGKTDAGEDFAIAANRELKEEIGYGANSMVHLKSMTIAPAYLEHATEIFLATDLYEEKLPGDEPEELELVPWRLDNINDLIHCGECSEARSLAAFFLTLEYFKHA